MYLYLLGISHATVVYQTACLPFQTKPDYSVSPISFFSKALTSHVRHNYQKRAPFVFLFSVFLGDIDILEFCHPFHGTPDFLVLKASSL